MQLLLFIAFYINQPIKTKDMTSESVWGVKTLDTVVALLVGLTKQLLILLGWERQKSSYPLIYCLTTVLFSMKVSCRHQRVVSIEFIELFIPWWSRRLGLSCQFSHHCHQRQQNAWAIARAEALCARQEMQTGIQIHQTHRNDKSRHKHCYLLMSWWTTERTSVASEWRSEQTSFNYFLLTASYL